MKKMICILYFLFFSSPAFAQREPLFSISQYFDEQTYSFVFNKDIFVEINAPEVGKFDRHKKTIVSLYALPNGNNISQTIGRLTQPGDDWHFNIQHIGAQTRFLRANINEYNFVTVYIENSLKSWPTWSKKYPNSSYIIAQLVDSIKSVFKIYENEFVLTGHSGGGRFIFEFMDFYKSIPAYIKRIAFLDSDYGYNNSYGDKLIEWLNNSSDHYLCVLAYNDSVALYNGKPFVSDTGGTWYRSRMMKNYFDSFMNFTSNEDSVFIKYQALDGRIKITLKKNPKREIYHTVQVERNGYIHSMLSGSYNEEQNYNYYGNRAYSEFIQENIPTIKTLSLPQRDSNSQSGIQFMNSVKDLPFEEREEKIFEEFIKGNFPDFLRSPIQIKAEFLDAEGISHTIYYQCMPDYLAIGSNEDYCRIPMSPKTAQKIADKFGMTLPTPKLVDNIHINATQKLTPITYPWSEGLSETIERFVEHSKSIDSQLTANHFIKGELVSGIKKDVVISNLLEDSTRINHVTIYGWHKSDGKPIQPLTNIHIDKYVDYSHGIRLINSEILIDGTIYNINDVLKDPVLYHVLIDGRKPLNKTSYLDN